MNNNTERWKQRFQNFSRAYKLLNSALEDNEVDSFSALEQEGIIQRFEYTYELAWKTLKDYLEFSGNMNISEITARNVFKQAFSANIIKDQKVFIDMMLSRNLLSHTYDYKKFEEILIKVKVYYLKALEELHFFFLQKVVDL